MGIPQTTPELRAHIGAKVRELRVARGLKQRELAERLGLSQARLSELERGQGSFSAEHLLELLRLFNVDISEFELGSSAAASLQNALVRHGARHLRESPESLVGPAHSTPAAAIRSVLLQPSSERFVTALAPVLVWSIDALSLPALQHDLVRAGVPGRLPWLLENILQALAQHPRPDDRQWRLRRARASVVIEGFLTHLHPSEQAGGALDPFEPGIRSKKSQEQVWARASLISRRWRIVSALQVEDFASALGAASAV
jgi:transcriptional regulator with XRE-family HTH domain